MGAPLWHHQHDAQCQLLGKSMKALFYVLLTLACGSQMAGQSSAVSDRAAQLPLRMEPFVITNFFDMKIELSRGKVTRAKVSTLAPSIKRQGVRVGDQLISIAGKPVAGMEVSAFNELVETPIPPGEKAVFVFRRSFGFLGGKSGTVNLEIKNTFREPDQSPETTPASAQR